MLFFRSEDRVRSWCARKGLPVRPMVSLAQLWRLSVTWYATRLEANSRRPGPGEMRTIFAGIGLDDPFWDPEGDRFG